MTTKTPTTPPSTPITPIRRSIRTPKPSPHAVSYSPARRKSEQMSRKRSRHQLLDDEIYGNDYASAIPSRVPLGFICGYPIKNGRGEIYTGKIFVKSAATDTLQGKAVEELHERWGKDVCIDEMAVCKKKYSPFVTRREVCPKTGRVSIKVKRMYGCHVHSDLRKCVIERFGERRGWEPFGQWSLQKATRMARKITEEQSKQQQRDEGQDPEDALNEKWYKQICINGSCVWKLKHKYDNITEELSEEKKSGTTTIAAVSASKKSTKRRKRSS